MKSREHCRGSGFTLLELMIAVSLLAAITAVTYMTFGVVVSAWRQSQKLMDHMHHGDFVMSQLVMALRSAYYPDARQGTGGYGFTMKDGGDGEYAADRIGWVKLGGALVGSETTLAGSPHRTQFWVGEDDEGRSGAAVRAWRVHGQPEDFEPEEEVDPFIISTRVMGFNCRTAYEVEDGEIEWLDEWEDTNRLPTMVEITLHFEPVEENGDPVEVSRVLEIPVGYLSWTRKKERPASDR